MPNPTAPYPLLPRMFVYLTFSTINWVILKKLNLARGILFILKFRLEPEYGNHLRPRI